MKKKGAFISFVGYTLSILMLLGSVYCITGIVNKNMKSSGVEDEVLVPVDDEVYEELPVVATESVIGRPYNNGNVKILQGFYDYRDDTSKQENSIIYYGNTYMQNSGVDYGYKDEFEVLSILDGTVSEVSEDDLMGKTVKIKHSNNLISVYQSLGDVSVKEGDNISSGFIIGKSGKSTINEELGNHLHFEIYYDGEVLNPESCFDKVPSSLNSGN